MMKKDKPRQNEPSGMLTSDDILGKEVIDLEGEFIGVSDVLYMNDKTFDVIGVSVDKGFLKKGLIIGKNYIDRVTPYAIFLKIKPAYKIKGMEVFDVKGKKIGLVTQVNFNGKSNSIKEIVVKKSMFKNVVIPANYIERVGYNVLLNVAEASVLEMKGSSDQENNA